MASYLVLIRGINVGGKNVISMTALKECLQQLGFAQVQTYIASGNVIVDTDKSQDEVRSIIETALPMKVRLNSQGLKALVLTPRQLQQVIDDKPQGFGQDPDKYHSDAIFLIAVEPEEAIKVFQPREGVDTIWPGSGVIYSQRLSAERTKSRLSSIMASPLYQSMTIRSWKTTTKLMDLLNARIQEGQV